eukprot:COSAG02_NODE_4073_length_5830_cov_3.915373_2_plen_244_part_00
MGNIPYFHNNTFNEFILILMDLILTCICLERGMSVAGGVPILGWTKEQLWLLIRRGRRAEMEGCTGGMQPPAPPPAAPPAASSGLGQVTGEEEEEETRLQAALLASVSQLPRNTRREEDDRRLQAAIDQSWQEVRKSEFAEWSAIGAPGQKAATVLGWTEASWGARDMSPFAQCWSGFSDQQVAAACFLGYDARHFAHSAPEPCTGFKLDLDGREINTCRVCGAHRTPILVGLWIPLAWTISC